MLYLNFYKIIKCKCYICLLSVFSTKKKVPQEKGLAAIQLAK